jgi:O-antigen/teichoic acid export membrane protein
MKDWTADLTSASTADAEVAERPTGPLVFAFVKSKLPTPSAVLVELRNPLVRNGHLLTLSSGLTALLGLVYWTAAAWTYDAATVGRNNAAVSMMMLVAAIAQLNLYSALIRFVPTAGSRTRRLVAGAYLLTGCAALVVGTGSVMLVRLVSPGTDFFAGSLAPSMFVVATVGYTFFVIQDGVLTGLRRTGVVPLENFLFAVLKLAMVVALASAMPQQGIFASWTVSLICVVLAVGVFLFFGAIPRRERNDDHADTLPPVRQLTRFVAFDYIGEICAVGAMTLMPIFVIAVLGAEQSAYFAIAWLIAYSIHQISLNMGSSLVLESSVDQSQLTGYVRHVLAHTSKLLLVIVIFVLITAPYLLGIFGHSYRQADGTLRLLCLAAVPHLLVATGLSSARAQRRMGLVVGIQVMQCVLALPMTWFLLPIMGMAGAGLAWLVTQSLIACGLLIRRDLWLTLGRTVPAADDASGPRPPTPGDVDRAHSDQGLECENCAPKRVRRFARSEERLTNPGAGNAPVADLGIDRAGVLDDESGL